MPIIDSVTLENFRCFREKQTVRLAPLTLLVGENSTGKTSFLALVQVLAELVVGQGWFAVPDFKKAPFDLGAFDDVVHDRGQGGRAPSFSAGFGGSLETRGSQISLQLDHTFGRRGAVTGIETRRVSVGDAWAEDAFDVSGSYVIRTGTMNRYWTLDTAGEDHRSFPSLQLLGA